MVEAEEEQRFQKWIYSSFKRGRARARTELKLGQFKQRAWGGRFLDSAN